MLFLVADEVENMQLLNYELITQAMECVGGWYIVGMVVMRTFLLFFHFGRSLENVLYNIMRFTCLYIMRFIKQDVN